MAGFSVFTKFTANDSFSPVLANMGKSTNSTMSKIDTLCSRIKIGFGTIAALNIPGFINSTIELGRKLFGVLSKPIRTASNFQQLQTSLEVLLGSQEKAFKMQKALIKYGAETPYETAGLAETAKLMLSFGIAESKVIPFMKAIGDVAMGDAQKMAGLSLAFSQASSVGKLMGQDFLQMVNAGFNPLEEMSRRTGKSIKILKDEMSKGKISAKMLQDAFISATSKGGKFYQMALKQSKTFEGLTSTFGDAVDTMFGDSFTKLLPQLQRILGKVIDYLPALEPYINSFVDALVRGLDYFIVFVGYMKNDVLPAWRDFAKDVSDFYNKYKELIIFIGISVGTYMAITGAINAYKAATIAAAAAQEFFAYQQYLANMAILSGVKTTPLMLLAQGKLGASIKLLTANLWANATAWLANPIIWIPTAIALVIGAIVLLWRNWDAVTAACSTAVDWLKGKFNQFKDFCLNIFQKIGDFFKTHFVDILLLALGPIGLIIRGVKSIFDIVDKKRGGGGSDDIDIFPDVHKNDPRNFPQGSSNSTIDLNINNNTGYPVSTISRLSANTQMNLGQT